MKNYELISSGKTEGVFQLESAGMTTFMKELRPERFEDIIAGIAYIGLDLWTLYQDILRKKPDKIVYLCHN